MPVPFTCTSVPPVLGPCGGQMEVTSGGSRYSKPASFAPSWPSLFRTVTFTKPRTSDGGVRATAVETDDTKSTSPWAEPKKTFMPGEK
ncbi:MAG: hypothetical protein U1F43_38070 [Myxococcota bacterium]